MMVVPSDKIIIIPNDTGLIIKTNKVNNFQKNIHSNRGFIIKHRQDEIIQE